MKLFKTALLALLIVASMSISYAAVAMVMYAAVALVTGSATAGLWASAITVIASALFAALLFACISVGTDSEESKEP